MDYNLEIRRILKVKGLNLRKFSERLGSSYQYVRFIMKPSEIRTVLWQRAFVLGYDLGKDDLSSCDCKKTESTTS